MSDSLKLTILDDNYASTNEVNSYKYRNQPFSNSNVHLAAIENFKLLTKGDDVKRVYDLKISTKDIFYDFLPGDTIGILPENNYTEIDKLLIRLNIEHNADKLYKLEISKDTVKKNPTLPKHIPEIGIVRDIFTYYIDIRKLPKKLFLKALIQFTTDSNEIQTLQEICSPKGSKQYSDLINSGGQTLLGLLNIFPTCFPPLEVILEHSAPLHPRFFSIASSPLENALHIAFFVVENDDGTKGVCTGWLEEIINSKERPMIPIYFRKPNNFRIPTDFSIQLILIATGTGVAPLKGFLDHRLFSKNERKDMGDAVLFYGCRYSERDFLYSNQLEEYLNKGVLSKLYTAFSRDGDGKCYVQDRIRENGEEFIDYILSKNAVVYVCGNYNMVTSVKATVVDILVKHRGFSRDTAEDYLKKLIADNRFIVDCWLLKPL